MPLCPHSTVNIIKWYANGVKLNEAQKRTKLPKLWGRKPCLWYKTQPYMYTIIIAVRASDWSMLINCLFNEHATIQHFFPLCACVRMCVWSKTEGEIFATLQQDFRLKFSHCVLLVLSNTFRQRHTHTHTHKVTKDPKPRCLDNEIEWNIRSIQMVNAQIMPSFHNKMFNFGFTSWFMLGKVYTKPKWAANIIFMMTNQKQWNE